MAERSMYCYTVPYDGQPHAIALSHSPVAVAVTVAVSGRFVVEFWAEHTEDAPQVRRWFQAFGTGQPLPAAARWAGTCPRTPAGLVLHLYEMPEPPFGHLYEAEDTPL